MKRISGVKVITRSAFGGNYQIGVIEVDINGLSEGFELSIRAACKDLAEELTERTRAVMVRKGLHPAEIVVPAYRPRRSSRKVVRKNG